MIPFGLETLLVKLYSYASFFFSSKCYQGILESDKKTQHITDFTAGSPSFSGWVLKTLTSSLFWGYGKLVSDLIFLFYP